MLDGNNLVVSAPTSSGKTMVGELAALRNVLERKRALFLLPLKALVADKRRHFAQVYGDFGVRTVEATGETDDITPLLRGQYDIGLLTYEKFAAIALTFPTCSRRSGVIVIDEAQMIADRSRGANLEFLLTLIRMRRREGIEPQIVALSAVIGDTNGLEQWLGARLLRRTERPVPLDEGLLLGNGQFRYIDAATGKERVEGPLVQRLYGKGSNQDLIIPLVRKLVAEGQQIIVFRETKSEARSVANYLGEALGLPPAANALAALPGGDPSQASTDLRNALSRGVAFHNADLEQEGKADCRRRIPPSGFGPKGHRRDDDAGNGRQHAGLDRHYRRPRSSWGRAVFGRGIQEPGRSRRAAWLRRKGNVLLDGAGCTRRTRSLAPLRDRIS